nr:MAG TPA: hypothetical protein [Caudoviricetes sp.]
MSYGKISENQSPQGEDGSVSHTQDDRRAGSMSEGGRTPL